MSDTTKWLIGLLVPIVLAMLALAGWFYDGNAKEHRRFERRQDRIERLVTALEANENLENRNGSKDGLIARKERQR